MKIQIFDYLKSITKEIIVTIFVTAIFAVGSYLPITKPFFIWLINIIIKNWQSVSITVLFLLVLYLLIVIKRFKSLYIQYEKKVNTMHTTSNEGLKKMLVETNSKVSSLDTGLSDMKTRLYHYEDDVREMKREHLYRKAERHEKYGQRGALLCRLEVVDLDAKNNSWKLGDSLEEIFQYVKKTSAFTTEDLSDIKNCLGKLKSDGHKEITEQIINIVKNKLV